MGVESIQFESGRRILGCYLPAGDPLALSNQAEIYLDSGVDFVEFGLPYEDPFLDGVVIQNAMARAFAADVTLKSIRWQLANIRDIFRGKPIVVVSYGNFDLRELISDNGELLFDAHLNLIDRPATRPRAGSSLACFEDLPSVGFVSHEVGMEEIAQARKACGYVLLQATPGKTGSSQELDTAIAGKIETLKASGIDVPILLAIGVASVKHVACAVEFGADGVIIGTRCVVEAAKGEPALRDFLVRVRVAVDGAE